jgi:hypothetical protein
MTNMLLSCPGLIIAKNPAKSYCFNYCIYRFIEIELMTYRHTKIPLHINYFKDINFTLYTCWAGKSPMLPTTSKEMYLKLNRQIVFDMF